MKTNSREIKFRLRIGKEIVGYERFMPTLSYGYAWHYQKIGETVWTSYTDKGEVTIPEEFYCTVKDQFTGLADIKGKEIYEGDIVRNKEGYCYRVIWETLGARFWFIPVSGNEVSNNHIGYEAPTRDKVYWFELEVIGTIF